MSYPIYLLLAALIVAIIDCYIERRQHRKTQDALNTSVILLYAALARKEDEGN